MELKSSWLKSTGLKLGVEISGVVMSFNLLGSLYAHSADRDWECYKKLEDDHVDLENNTGKSFSEIPFLALTNQQYDQRLFIES